MKTCITLAILPIIGAALAAPQQARPRFGGPLRAKHSKNTGFITDSNWAGAVQEGNGWTAVTAQTTIPIISSGDSSQGAAGWVGIDGKPSMRALVDVY